ncbi:MAG: PspA/IM30 family protein [Myxococcales bacterium]|nr:PspA/IM30 family protein [Myxococcales bacterium]
MGLFTRMKDGVKSKANAALDKAIDPAKEIEMAILELEEQRKAALAELISYKATAKQMEQEQAKFEERAATWEKRAMAAVKAGDDEAAKQALREKKAAQVEAVKIRKDRDEAASYAIQLNKSRKEFETKLQILKLKKGTLATQLASARSASGDAFGHDGEVWDKFARAESKIEDEAIATEVDAAMRGEAEADAALASSIAKLPAGAAAGDDALAAIKAKVAAEREARAERLAAAAGKALPAGTPRKPEGEA